MLQQAFIFVGIIAAIVVVPWLVGKPMGPAWGFEGRVIGPWEKGFTVIMCVTVFGGFEAGVLYALWIWAGVLAQ